MNNYNAILLKSGLCELELVPEFGGITNKLILASASNPPLNIISGLANRHEMETDQGYHGIPLFPLVNRLDKGQYQYKGKKYQLEANETALNNALHGFIHHFEPSVSINQVSQDHSVACLRYDYDGSISGYPFPAQVDISYTLKSEGSLLVEFKVTNKHTESIPLGIGWHPYFQLGEKVDQLKLQLPKVKHTPVDSRMLPTGDKNDFQEFESLTQIGARKFDDCFEIQDIGDIVNVTLWSESKHRGFQLWQQTGDRAYNFIQVCIPPNRESIAIEPVSCGINALNTKDGLIELAAGESFSSECGIKCI